MKEDMQRTGIFAVAFGAASLWHNIATIDISREQRAAVKLRGVNNYLSVNLCQYRLSTKEELYRIGQNGTIFPLALYNGYLYGLCAHFDEKRNLVPEMCELTIGRKCVYLVQKNMIDAIYAGCFDIQYKQNWYRCDMIGGTNENAVSVVVADPHKNTGLSSPYNTYMWGNGVEIKHSQIEAVRLYISDSVTAQFWE